jgi:hypothetical protein
MDVEVTFRSSIMPLGQGSTMVKSHLLGQLS